MANTLHYLKKNSFLNNKKKVRAAERAKRAAVKKQVLFLGFIATFIIAAGIFGSGYWSTTAGSSLSAVDNQYNSPNNGRNLLSSSPSPSATSNLTRCGGEPCKSLTNEKKAKFCASDPYPSEMEITAAGIDIKSVGALYDFYCSTYGYPPQYDAAVGCGAMTCEALNSGGILLPLIGMLYMFLGLAIVCDEFFVPALEIIVEKGDIDDDVAGATFMAAGGSAPELFTALISTFVAPPSAADTGFGTIVGSAVFNVLFVIGACAIFSKGVLKLSWWPLFRDATFYTIGLSVLAVFFGTGSYDEKLYPASMEWWECTILFLLYIIYVILMKYNRWVHFYIMKRWVTKKKEKERKKSMKSAGGSTGGTPNNTKISPSKPPLITRKDSSRSVLLETLSKRAQDGMYEKRSSSMHFRAGVLHLMVSEKSLLETAGIHLVTKVEGDVKATFASVAGESQKIDKEGLKKLLKCMGLEGDVSDAECANAFSKLDKNNDLSLDWAEFKEWYSSSEAKIWADCDNVFKEIDKDGDGKISRSELVYLLNQILGREPMPEEVDEAWMELLSKATAEELESEVEDDVMCIPQKLFNEWFAKSVFFEDRQNAGAVIVEKNESFFPPWPDENIQAKLLYIVSLPLIVPMYLTIPDVTKARFEKFFMISFLMSIAWIAIFACKYT
jgi:sodium/potassium/calcium exchanger 1